MEFLFFLFFLFIAFNVVRGFAKEAKANRQQPAEERWRLEPEGHVYQVGGTAAPGLPAPRPAPAADPWWEVEDAADLPEITLAEAPAPMELAVYEGRFGELEVAPRPLPAAPLALDGEVDRAAEHARLHARIAQPPRKRPAPRRAAAHDLLSGADALRRAVLTAEILGPPRALREPD